MFPMYYNNIIQSCYAAILLRWAGCVGSEDRQQPRVTEEEEANAPPMKVNQVRFNR